MGLWTIEHVQTLIPSVIFMVLIGIVLRSILGKKDIKIRMIPFQILACILFAIEIGKQIVSLSRGYDLYHLPFHFCSIFIFILPFAAFYRGKHKDTVHGVTAAVCGAVFLLILIYPNLIYGAGSINEFFTEYLSFHTVAFHNIVLMEFVLIIALNLHTPNLKKEQKTAVIFMVCFCVIAATMAQILKTNFANMYICNIPPLETLRLAVENAMGVVFTKIFYVAIVSSLHVLFTFVAYWVYTVLTRLINKNQY